MELFWTVGIGVLALTNALFLVLLLSFARELGVILVRLGPAVPRVGPEGPAVGSAIGDVDYPGLEGEVFHVGPNKSGRKLVVFVAPACPSCVDLAPALRTVAIHYRDRVTVSAITAVQPTTRDAAFVRELGPLVRYGFEPTLLNRLNIPGTPYALLLDADNVVLSKGVVNNLEQVESLFSVQVAKINAAAVIGTSSEGGRV